MSAASWRRSKRIRAALSVYIYVCGCVQRIFEAARSRSATPRRRFIPRPGPLPREWVIYAPAFALSLGCRELARTWALGRASYCADRSLFFLLFSSLEECVCVWMCVRCRWLKRLSMRGEWVGTSGGKRRENFWCALLGLVFWLD